MSVDKRGLIATSIIHTLLVIVFFTVAFKTPLPLPAEQGILINFGDINFASGPVEPKKNIEEKKEPQPTPPPKPVEEVKQPVATQDFEEAAAVEPVPKKPKEQPKKEEKVPPKEPEKKEEPKKEEPPKVDARALYKGKNENTSQTGSEGDATGSGNQGSPTGSPDTQNRIQGLSSGDGVSFSLNGRNPVSLPKPVLDHQREGKVVVEVTVDRSGNVINAEAGVKGSTTLDSYLLGIAKKAALSSKFDQKPDAPFYQKGTITYVFKLR